MRGRRPFGEKKIIPEIQRIFGIYQSSLKPEQISKISGKFFVKKSLAKKCLESSGLEGFWYKGWV
jgi:hypothetical protein